MSKSQETWNKKEREKNKQKNKKEKEEKKQERRENSKDKKSFEDMLAYIDENGHISATPPDPRKKINVNVEDIEIGVPKQSESDEDNINEGAVNYFNESKGFGFIIDKQSGERLFFHVNQLLEAIKEHDKVTYDIEKGPKGYNAVNIKKL